MLRLQQLLFVLRLFLALIMLGMVITFFLTHGAAILEGDSLFPLFRSGTYIVYHKTQDVEVGDIIIFYPEGSLELNCKVVWWKFSNGNVFIAGFLPAARRSVIARDQIVGRRRFIWPK